MTDESEIIMIRLIMSDDQKLHADRHWPRGLNACTHNVFPLNQAKYPKEGGAHVAFGIQENAKNKFSFYI